jgi:hypothetical protein
MAAVVVVWAMGEQAPKYDKRLPPAKAAAGGASAHTALACGGVAPLAAAAAASVEGGASAFAADEGGLLPLAERERQWRKSLQPNEVKASAEACWAGTRGAKQSSHSMPSRTVCRAATTAAECAVTRPRTTVAGSAWPALQRIRHACRSAQSASCSTILTASSQFMPCSASDVKSFVAHRSVGVPTFSVQHLQACFVMAVQPLLRSIGLGAPPALLEKGHTLLRT